MNKFRKALTAGTVAAGLILAGGVVAANAVSVTTTVDSGTADSLLIQTDPSTIAPTDQNETLARETTKRVAKAGNPRDAFVKLSKTERKLFKAYNFMTKVAEDTDPAVPIDSVAERSVASNPRAGLTITAAVAAHPTGSVRAGVPANGCWSVPGGTTGLNAFGGALWRISHTHQLCVTNGRVTKAAYQSTSGQGLVAGWRWVKLDGKATGVVNGQSRQYVQHKFALGLNGWDIQVLDPCSRSAGTASGNVIPSSACNITLG